MDLNNRRILPNHSYFPPSSVPLHLKRLANDITYEYTPMLCRPLFSGKFATKFSRFQTLMNVELTIKTD